MADVDLSTYPRAALPVSPLEVAGQVGGLLQRQKSLQSADLGINQQKLDQANQALTYLTRSMISLGPDANKDAYFKVGENLVKMGLAPPDMLGTFKQRLDDAPTSRDFFNEVVTTAATHKEALDWHMGQPGMMTNGQQTIPVTQSQKFGIRSTGLPIQAQVPPTAAVVDNDPNSPTYGQPKFSGPQPAVAAPGAVTAPPPMSNSRLPVQPPAAISRPTVTIQPPANPAFATQPVVKDQGRAPVGNPASPVVGNATGPAIGMPPLFEAGKKQLVEDQDLATARLTAIKPALQALPLLKDLRSGPGTETFNKAVAFLKANNIIPTDATNDPTAIYQEVSKKLAQYVQGNPVGQRSDAAQALSEASSPNPKTQINPALIKLTKDAIILDRVAAARPNAFEGQDFSKYGAHRSTFPARVDEKAFGLDLMEPKERQDLLDTMKKKANTFEGKKFWNSLATVKKLGLYNVSGE